MKTCCKHYNSAFCPDCGSPLKQLSPIDALLNHVRRTASNCEHRAEGNPHTTWPKAAKKWRIWCDALEKILKEKEYENETMDIICNSTTGNSDAGKSYMD